MKYKIITLLAFILLFTGCKVYVYDVGSNSNNNNGDESSNLTQTGTGTTIITGDLNYNGKINFTTTVPDGNNSWDSIYENVKNSVVTVRNIKNNLVSSTGSGVFFAEDPLSNGNAYIFTNAHVVKGSQSVEILLANGKLVEGTLIGYDDNEDVAVIKIKKRSDYTIATLRKTETLKIGEKVLAIGSPIGEKYSETATSGIISNLNIDIQPDNNPVSLYLIQIDAALNPGNSGGPLFDNEGNLIGINTIKLVKAGSSDNIESFNYAIPISHFALVAEYLLQGAKYYRPYLNIKITDIRYLTFNQRSQDGITVDNGLLLVEIGENSPLYSKVAIKNIITHIENVEIIKANDFSVELLKYKPEDTITLTICNADGSNIRQIDVTLMQRTN